MATTTKSDNVVSENFSPTVCFLSKNLILTLIKSIYVPVQSWWEYNTELAVKQEDKTTV